MNNLHLHLSASLYNELERDRLGDDTRVITIASMVLEEYPIVAFKAGTAVRVGLLLLEPSEVHTIDSVSMYVS